MDKETFIEEKTLELKQYVGLSMSKEECRIFITTTCYGFLQASTDKSKLLLADVSNCNSCKWHKCDLDVFPCEFCNKWDKYEKL